jgi:hypothetical protein
MGKINGRSGGGIESRQVAETKNPKREPVNCPVSPGAVSRLGGMVGVGTPEKKLYYNRQPFTTPEGPSDMSLQGPGAGRRILPSGSQSAVKAPTPMSEPRRSLFK